MPTPEEIRAEVDRIAAGPGLVRSDRLCRFLRFVVEQTLAGRGEDLKEYSIGIEVYDKGSDFDPRIDSAVRVDARRLRTKLAEYYATAGLSDPIRIELPKGGYVPIFAGTPARTKATAVTFRLGAAITSVIGLVVIGARLISGGSGSETRADAPHVTRAVVVLPFVNLTGKLENDVLCEGFADELTGRLARISRLRVVSQTSAYAYKDKLSDIRKVARELQVDSVVEGTVRQSTDSLRVTVKLVRGDDGSHVWSESVDLPLADQVGMQSQVGQIVENRLASNADPAFEPGEQRLEKLVERAAHLAQRRTEESLWRAVEAAEEGVRGKPQFARGYAVLADAYFGLADHHSGAEAQRLLRDARQNAEKALSLNPGLAGPLATLGVIALDYGWQWKESEDLFRRALDKNPNHATTHARYSRLLSLQGRFDDSLDQARHAEILAPLSILSAATVAHTLFFGRRYGQAVSAMQKVLLIDPGYDSGRMMIARANGLMGNFEQAWAALEDVSSATKDRAEHMSLRAWLLATQGRTTEARPLLLRMEGATSTSRAGAYASVRDRETAFKVLEDAVRAKDQNLVYLKVSPSLDPLRPDPRLEKLCIQVGLSGCRSSQEHPGR